MTDNFKPKQTKETVPLDLPFAGQYSLHIRQPRILIQQQIIQQQQLRCERRRLLVHGVLEGALLGHEDGLREDGEDLLLRDGLVGGVDGPLGARS